MTSGPALPQPAPDHDEAPDPVYGSVQDWVTRHFLPMYRRPARRGVPVVPAMVAARRGHHPAHRAVAVVGGPAAATRHRDDQLAARLP